MTSRVLALSAVLLSAAGGAAFAASEPESRAGVTVAVAAAADLQTVFAELREAFHAANPDVDARPTFGSSGGFHAQIRNAAPFDVFLSADTGYPESLRALGLVDGEVFVYASGRLAIVVPASASRPTDPPGIRLLAEPALGRIAIANPAHAPYGRLAESALAKAGLLDAVRARLVLGENVAQAAQFVETGAAGAGLVALPLARAAERAGRLRVAALPRDSHPPLRQGGVVLRAAREPAAARAFRDFLRGPTARAILARHGFDDPP